MLSQPVAVLVAVNRARLPLARVSRYALSNRTSGAGTIPCQRAALSTAQQDARPFGRPEELASDVPAAGRGSSGPDVCLQLVSDLGRDNDLDLNLRPTDLAVVGRVR